MSNNDIPPGVSPEYVPRTYSGTSPSADPFAPPAGGSGTQAQPGAERTPPRPYDPVVASPYASPASNPYGPPTGNPYGPPAGNPYGQGIPGSPYPQYQGASPYVAGTNGLAIASLVTSLLGLGVVGVILGHIALSQLKTSGQEGRGLAIAGLVIGYLQIALVVVGIIAAVFLASGSAS